ncbi:hypothetical protein GCM10009733_038180 [Nonomuraea maheshkhaliensis]|uniref:histidine kinase n=1 Tax=Nonomuraea maheshkhaliensis TaxID=419590 RepID=A0ABP4R5K0_9ACTN
MRELSRFVPVALRLGVIVLLIVALVRATPAPGLTGMPLVVTLLTVALALSLLAVLFLSHPWSLNRKENGSFHREGNGGFHREGSNGFPSVARRSTSTGPPSPQSGSPLPIAGQDTSPRRLTGHPLPVAQRRAKRSHSPTGGSLPAAWRTVRTHLPTGRSLLTAWRSPRTRFPASVPAVWRTVRARFPARLQSAWRTVRTRLSSSRPSGWRSERTEDRPAGGLLSEAWRRMRRSGASMSQLATTIALGLAVLLSIALNSVTHSGATIGSLLVSISLAVSRLPLGRALAIALLAVAGLIVAGGISGAPVQDLTLVLSVCLIFLVTYAGRQRKAARAAEAREAVLAERARIAREIHDILAHSLSAQLVHLEGAKLLLRAERTAEALDRVTHARDLAKAGLEEAGRAVSALREDPPELPVALRSLAENFESTTHRPCTLRISGPGRRLPPETELALLRTAQEALTNVRRHAPGSPAEVELDFSPAWCDLRVINPSSAGTQPTETGSPRAGSPETGSHGTGSTRGGYGLVGMRERAELLGGTLSAGESDGVFLVHLRVPA